MKKSLLAGLDLPELPQPKPAPASVSQPKPTETQATSPWADRPGSPATPAWEPVTEPPQRAAPAITLPGGSPKRKAGRPRILADRPLTGREKAARYRQKHKALAARAMTGGVDAAGLSHTDLCRVVARMLNRSSDLELRQMGLPLVKELQRRLKSL